MLRQVKLAGGKVKGVLWYQGESDSSPERRRSTVASSPTSSPPSAPTSASRTCRSTSSRSAGSSTAAIRRAGTPCRKPSGGFPSALPNTAVISVIDLELDDCIHVGTQGMKRAGPTAGEDRPPRAVRPGRRDDADLRPRLPGAEQHAGRQVQGGQHGPRPAPMQRMGMGMAMRGMASNNMPPAGGTVMRAPRRAAMRMNRPASARRPRIGLQPERHIGGFSIRKEDGTPAPLDLRGRRRPGTRHRRPQAHRRDSPRGVPLVRLRLRPYCNLTDSADMAVPVFGPIALDEAPEAKAVAAVGIGQPEACARSPSREVGGRAPVKLLIITGDHGHDWKATTESLKADPLRRAARSTSTSRPRRRKDLTDENLAKYDVLLLNYKDTAKGRRPETKWSDANKEAFLKAVREGKGLVVLPLRLDAFAKPNWEEFEKAIAGGWRIAGLSTARSMLHGEEDDGRAPDLQGTAGRVRAQDRRAVPELDDAPAETTFWRRPTPTRASPRGRARTSRSSGSTTTARGASTSTPSAMTSRP